MRLAAQGSGQIGVDMRRSGESRKVLRRIDVECTRQLIDNPCLRYASTAQHPHRPNLILADIVDIITEFGNAVSE